MNQISLTDEDSEKLIAILEPLILEETRKRSARIVYSEEIFWADAIMLQLGWSDDLSERVKKASDEGMEIFRKRDPIGYKAVADWLGQELKKIHADSDS
jgi:hypothetical protein